MAYKRYEKAEMEIIEFEVEDIIAASITEATTDDDGGFGYEEEEGFE